MRPGLTLIELMVSVAILAVIILAVGYIFSQTSRAVNATQATMDVNAGIRATMAQMRRDMQGLSRKGFLILIEGTDDEGPVIAFTATGRFESQTSDARANAAIIVYSFAEDEAAGNGAPSILTRRAFLLSGTGNTSFAQAVADDNLDLDVLALTIGDLQSVAWNTPRNADDLILQAFVWPLIDEPPPLNTAEQTLEAIDKLWPYVQGGVADPGELEVCFRGGYRLDQSLVWDSVASVGPAPAPDPQGHYETLWYSGERNGRRYVIWTHHDTRLWPLAIRLRNLQLQDVAGRSQPVPYEIVLDLPRWGLPN